MILPDYLLDEHENSTTSELTLDEQIYNQSIRIMVEHDRKLKGLEDQGIFCAGKFVGDEDSVQFEHGGDSHRADLIDKTKFDDRRAILNSNTLLKNVLKKDKNLAKEIGEMNKHMEVRRHCIIFKKCTRELGDKLCKPCKRVPHTIPPEVLKDLPKKDQGGGAKFWDLMEDPSHPGHYRTLLDAITCKEAFQPDKFVPLPFGRCKEENCSFSFTSTAEAERHLKHDHGFANKDANAPAGYVCGFKDKDGIICQSWFAKRSGRDSHKKASDHVNKRKGTVEDE